MRIIAGHLAVLLACLLPSLTSGRIKDDIACSECHTMHNSQNLFSMTGDGAEQALLVSTCVGCHTGTNVDPAASGYPYVLTTSGVVYGSSSVVSGGNTLAGGNFYWVMSGDRKGHNVAGIADEDDQLHKTPPGSETGAMAGQLTCAGINGCHGDRTKATDLDALKPGSHHISDNPSLGTSVPDSFRFLNGVKGFEDTDWEYTVNVTTGLEDHNQYYGSINESGVDENTISYFCGRCHGDFHGNSTDDGDMSSPWLRHPTDTDLPTSGEHGTYASYNPQVPVASTIITAPLGTFTDMTNQRIIACISCHRAHGSPYDGILRWDYKAWPNGGYNGCGGCHSYKN